MALKSGNPTTYRSSTAIQKRHQRVKGGGRCADAQRVGETPQQRTRTSYKAKSDDLKQVHRRQSFFTKLYRGVQNIFGIKAEKESGTIGRFAANAEYMDSTQTITQYHRNLEQGIKSRDESTDGDLLSILKQVETIYSKK